MGHRDYTEEYDEKKSSIVREILGFLLYVMMEGIIF